MGNEHSNQRGFFLAIVVLVGVALLASYFNAGAEGNVVARRSVSTLQNAQAQQSNALLPSSSLDELDTPQNAQGNVDICQRYSHWCTAQRAYSRGAGKTEKEAQDTALADCKTKVLAAQQKIKECLAELASKMLSCLSDSQCEVDSPDKNDDLNPARCQILSCAHIAPADDPNQFTECRYEYQGGYRIEPGLCRIVSPRSESNYPYSSPGWYCTAADGSAYYGFSCKEKRRE